MSRSAEYEEIFYSSFSIEVENVLLTITLDSGFISEAVTGTQMHSHPIFEVQGGLLGDFRVQLPEGESVCVREDTLALIPPDLYHAIKTSGTAKRFTLRFSVLPLESDRGEDIYQCFRSVKNVIFLEEAPELIALFYRIRAEYLQPTSVSLALCKAYLTEFLLLLYRRISETVKEAPQDAYLLARSDDENARYNKIEIFINAHLGEQLREEHLAESLGLSVRQTSRIMQSIFGMSFKQKLLQMRLYYAKGLLSATKEPVESIAEAVGYSSCAGFHIAFRRTFGMTPMEYRAKIQANT